MACLMFIITSTVRFNCDYNALHTELQQLGLPREHSAAIRKIIEECAAEIRKYLKKTSLQSIVIINSHTKFSNYKYLFQSIHYLKLVLNQQTTISMAL